MVTQARLKELFFYDPGLGLLKRIVSTSRKTKAGDVAGHTNQKGYLKVIVDKVQYQGHRLICMYVHCVWPDQIDHINGNKSDNRIVNLRSVTNQENHKNQKRCKLNTSGVTGVYWHRANNKWNANIVINGVRNHIGYFKYKWDAICARKSAERRHGFHINHGRAM